MPQKEARWGQPGQKVCSRFGTKAVSAPEFLSVFRGNRGRIDPQDPADGGGHKVRIQLPDHRERSVVLPVKGLDPDLPRLLRGEDLDLVFEKREHLLDDQDLLRPRRCLFSSAGGSGHVVPSLRMPARPSARRSDTASRL